MNCKLFCLLPSLKETRHCFSNYKLIWKMHYQKRPGVHLVQLPTSGIRRSKNMPCDAPGLLCKAVSQGEKLSPSLSLQMCFAFK